jgi:hypothetical protein
MFLSTGHGEFYGIPHQRPQRSTIDEKKMLLWDEIINCNAVFDMFEHHKIQLCACIVCFEGMHGRVGKDSTAHFCQLDKKYMGGVFIKPRIFEAQEPLQPVEQGYEKAQWYANIIIDFTHEVWSHESLCVSLCWLPEYSSYATKGRAVYDPMAGHDALMTWLH